MDDNEGHMARWRIAQSTMIEAIFEAVPSALAEVDLQHRLVRVNRQWAELADRPTAELVGHNVCDSLPKLLAEALEDSLSSVSASSQAICEVEIAGNTVGASWCYSVQPICKRPGELSSMLVALQAVPLQQQVLEDSLREHERRYRDTIEAIPGLFWWIDRQYRIREWNKQMRNVSGYSDEELDHLSVPKLIVPEEWERVKEAIDRGLRNGSTFSEFTMRTKDGRRIPFFGAGERVVISGEELLVGLSIDMSDLVKARESLQERLAFEARLVEISSRFVGTSHTALEAAVNTTVGWFRKVLDADYVLLVESQEEETKLVVTHACSLTQLPDFPEVHVSERFPWFADKLRNGETVRVRHLDELPDEAARDIAYAEEMDVQAVLAIPLRLGESNLGAMIVMSGQRTDWPDELIPRLELVTHMLANSIGQHRKSLEIERLKSQLEEENIYLRQEVRLAYPHEEIVAQSEAMKQVLMLAEKVADTESTVLIQGETGTGKELLARAIHSMSSRRSRVMIVVNCASLPAALVESELFGREKGAYTGSMSRQPGRFEVADGSTIMLDEIGELPLEVQAKLLRVLQDGGFERLGSSKTIRVDVRVIAATNRDLAGAVTEGRFREDLYYRLSVFPIEIPPLRSRRDDIEPLVWRFVREFSERMGRRIDSIPRDGMSALVHHQWPGNVRELRNAIERAVILSSGSSLDVPPLAHPGLAAGASLEEVERAHIVEVLTASGWRVKGEHGAAAVLGLKPSTLFSRMKKLGIQRP
jgi:PAS domain S-box-containing protein